MKTMNQLIAEFNAQLESVQYYNVIPKKYKGDRRAAILELSEQLYLLELNAITHTDTGTYTHAWTKLKYKKDENGKIVPIVEIVEVAHDFIENTFLNV